MKRSGHGKALVLCAMFLFLTSCVKEEAIVDKGNFLSDFTAQIQDASRENTFDTKAEVTVSTGKVEWEAGDSIAVTNGTDISIFVYSDQDGKFHTDTPLAYAEGFKAIYPAKICKGLASGGFSVCLPSGQTYHADCVKEAPMSASSKTATFNFKNLCSILVVKVSSDKKLSSMNFTSGELAVCGDATVADDALTMAQTSPKTLTLETPDAVQLGENSELYLVLPSQVYTGGFSLALNYSDGTALYESTTKTIALSPGRIDAMSAFSQIYFCGGMGTMTNPWKIATVEDLEFLSEKSYDGNLTFRNEYYEQVCDIDFKGASFTSIGRNLYFLGTYDGKGHKITNCKISNPDNPAGIFANLGSGGKVMNLTLDASTVSGTVNKVGGIVGYCNGGAITNCTVTESCSVIQSVAKKHELGGIVGSAISTSTLKGCRFDGKLSGPCGNMGGILGNINGTTVVDDCHVGPTAQITGGNKDTDSGCNIAGIVGYMNGASSSVTAVVKNCSFAGTVTGHWCDNGGIVGRLNNGTVTDCESTGTINCDFDDSASVDPSGSETTHSNTGGIAGWVGGSWSKLGDCVSKSKINTACRFVGGVLGFANNGNIYNCDFIDGTLTATLKAGGIAGYLYNYGVRGCHVRNSTITVSGGTAGGIAGYNYACMISDCHFEEGSILLGGGKGKHNMGGIAGVVYGYAGIIRECTIGGKVVTGSGIVGGAVGLLQYGLVRNTVLKGTAEVGSSSASFNYIGGMVGEADSKGGYVMECSVESGAKISCPGQGCGGMVGYMEKGEISGCTVIGAAISSGTYYCGGIVGQVKASATDGTAMKIQNNNVIGGTLTGCTVKGHCGGIVGYVAGSVMIDKCHSSINLNTGSPVGGIAGKIYGNANLLSNCLYYNGTITAGGDNGGVGGIAGVVDATSTYTNTIVNCAAYPEQITYSKGSVSGISPAPESSVTNCYSPVDGGGEPTLSALNAAASSYNSGAPLYDVKASDWVAGTNGKPVQAGSPIASSQPGSTKKKVALMGDSISTFTGWTPYPKGNGYPLAKWPDVTKVEQVYWHILIYDYMTDCELDVNSSYSGSCVMNTTSYGYPGRSFLQRYTDLKNPDVIFINGGTNDCMYGGMSLPMGKLNFDLPDDQLDTYTFAGAYDKLIRLLKAKFPSAKIGLICGDYPNRNRTEGKQIILDIAEHYGLPCAVVSFSDLSVHTEDDIHPTAAGHQVMADQIWDKFKNEF